MPLADEFRANLGDETDQHLLLKGLTLALLDFARDGKRVLVCLDEAQAMPLESLEVLRLLTNLETEKRKLMQVVLFGQPELDDRLQHHSVRPLRQRISFQYFLKGLQCEEVGCYLQHRCKIAGYADKSPFSEGAVRAMYKSSKGTPRLINILAHKALLLAYGEGLQCVLPRHVLGAVADTPEARRHRWRFFNFLAWPSSMRA